MGGKKIYYILIGIIGVAVIITVILILRGIGGGNVKRVTLEFWGVFDDRNAFDKAITDFQSQNPNIHIVYQMMDYASYEKNLVNAMAAGTGPDILMIHNSWLPKHGDKLKAMPDKLPGQSQPLMTISSFKNQFVDVAYDDLVYQNQIYALPLYVDTLALYYNKDLFNSAGISHPPENWSEFNSDVQLLTKLDSLGNIIQAGAAIGTARNINRSTDVLTDLMLQTGVQMNDPSSHEVTITKNVNGVAVGIQALQYYTDFANPSVQTYTWNDNMHYSVDAFTEGTTAMMFDYSHELQVLRQKAPRLNLGIAPMPQASSSDVKNYADYWALAVSNKSQYPNEAWKFLVYLSSKDPATNYLNTTLRPSARRDLLELQKDDADLGVFAVQALSGKTWYQPDETVVETVFADMIDDVNFHRRTIKDALANAEDRINVLMH